MYLFSTMLQYQKKTASTSGWKELISDGLIEAYNPNLKLNEYKRDRKTRLLTRATHGSYRS